MFRQSSQEDSWQRGLWSEWVSIMETPTHTTRQDREHLSSVERNTLLPSEHEENKSNPEINISRVITVSGNMSTPIRERMVSMQCKNKDMARTLFIRDSEVVSVVSVWRICSRWVGCAVTVRRWS